MRLWLDPDLIAARGLTAGDVIAAVREQNVQVAAGSVGQTPDSNAAFQVTVNTLGRLADEKQFGDIIIRTGSDGRVTRLRDVARIEMGADAYALRSLLDGEPAVALQIIQSPGANALDVAQAVRATVKRLEGNFPAGLSSRIAYDPTVFVRASLESVVTTLLEAILLVVIVVVVFLRSWRASLIPLLAVPVSLVGTFAIMYLMGFSLNTLSLFGLVLSIGIVVDDAIVVVENVERHIENGKTPQQAARLAMDEVTEPNRRHHLGAGRGFRSNSVPERFTGRVLPAVRADHRHFNPAVGAQFAYAQPGAGGHVAAASSGETSRSRPHWARLASRCPAFPTRAGRVCQCRA